VAVSANRGQKGKAHVGKEDRPTSLSRHFWQTLAAEVHFDFAIFMEHAPVSARQVRRIFQQNFGCCPEKWFLEFKLRSALALVRRGYKTKAVVDELHFPSAAYFCREFKKQYGASPKHFHPAWQRRGAKELATEARRRRDDANCAH
jgi:AraC-like DNA-binding protein